MPMNPAVKQNRAHDRAIARGATHVNVQERSRVCDGQQAADEFIAKLPKRARERGLIEQVALPGGGVLVTATWEARELRPIYAEHPAWDQLHLAAWRADGCPTDGFLGRAWFAVVERVNEQLALAS